MLHERATIQAAAKRVLADLKAFISADATEASIAAFARQRLEAQGYPDTWYYSCHALVLLGSRSCLPISGRDYMPSTERVGETNLVTVDLSPCLGDVWGDCARSFAVEGGRACDNPADPGFADGLRMLRRLHNEAVDFIGADTSFEQLYIFANDLISSEGNENLDLLGNLGHSIVSNLGDRVYIEKGNRSPLSSADCFTFEPHIRIKGGAWGYKHEEIYHYVDRDRVAAL